MVQALRDAAGRGHSSHRQVSAETLQRQVRLWPASRDFALVASLAGLDPAVARGRFDAALKSSDLDDRLSHQGAGRRKQISKTLE